MLIMYRGDVTGMLHVLLGLLFFSSMQHQRFIFTWGIKENEVNLLQNLASVTNDEFTFITPFLSFTFL